MSDKAEREKAFAEFVRSLREVEVAIKNLQNMGVACSIVASFPEGSPNGFGKNFTINTGGISGFTAKGRYEEELS